MKIFEYIFQKRHNLILLTLLSHTKEQTLIAGLISTSIQYVANRLQRVLLPMSMYYSQSITIWPTWCVLQCCQIFPVVGFCEMIEKLWKLLKTIFIHQNQLSLLAYLVRTPSYNCSNNIGMLLLLFWLVGFHNTW